MRAKILLLLITLSVGFSLYGGNDSESIKRNWIEFLTEDRIADSDIEFIDLITEQGSWSDIDYSDDRRGNWTVIEHLRRAVLMARAYSSESSPSYNNPKLLKQTISLFNFWIDKGLVNRNWWYPQIGVPQELGVIMLLLEDHIEPSYWDGGLKIMDKVEFGGKTGQNLVWVSSNIILRSILNGDSSLLEEACGNIVGQMRIEEGAEGVQADLSFHQHGAMLQFGNYGLHFVEDQTKWISILNGTDYDYSSEQIQLMRDYILKGQKWVVYKGVYDISASGRQLFPNEQIKKRDRLFESLTKLSRVDPEYKEQYYNIIGGELFEGAKFFYRSDYGVYRSDSYFSSFKGCSNRVIGAESGNGENISGYYLGDGVLQTMQTGKEYLDIFPYWDWRHLPGTTSVQDSAKLKQLSWSGYHIKSDFVGGVVEAVADGDLMVTTMKYRRDSTIANKSYIFTDNYILCLGSGISSENGKDLHTTVEQKISNTPTYYKGSEGVVKLDSGEVNNLKASWVWSGDVGYITSDTENLYLRANEVECDWNRVVTWPDMEQGSKRPIFTLAADHSMKNSSYNYSIVPGVALEQMGNCEEMLGYNVVENSAAVHAVEITDKLSVIVFFEAGSVQVNKREISSSIPAIVLLDRSSSKPKLTVVDPTQKLSQGEISISGRLKLAGAVYDKKSGKTVAKFEW